MIIGLSGKIGCGKTVMTELLLKRLGPGWTRIAFGDALKEEAAAAFGLPVDCMYSQEGKAGEVAVDPLAYDAMRRAMTDEYPEFEVPALPRNPITVRELLQWYGTDVCRAACPNYWVDATARKCALCIDNILIDDVRFLSEAKMVLTSGGLLIRMDPYDGWEPGEYAGHASETALDDYQGFTVRIAPGYGELEIWADALAERIKEAQELVA